MHLQFEGGGEEDENKKAHLVLLGNIVQQQTGKKDIHEE